MAPPPASLIHFTRIVIALAAGAASFGTPVAAQPPASSASRDATPGAASAGSAGARTAVEEPIRAFFSCAAGRSIRAVFTNGAQSHVALTLSDGRKLSVPQAMSGSGVRYANSDESFVFWNKGNSAIIEENGKTTYSGYTTKSSR